MRCDRVNLFVLFLALGVACAPPEPPAGADPEPGKMAPAGTEDRGAEVKDAMAATSSAQAAVKASLPFDDTRDFEAADKGFIARIEDGIIKNEAGDVVWDIGKLDFVADAEAPDTVNPSLWRQAQLLQKHGLYEVVEGVYQVRGYDLSNMSLVRGDKGWVVIDPLVSAETAKAGLDLVREHVEDVPVTAVIFTHSHIDHYGGVHGVVTDEQLQSGSVPIYAPEGFLAEAVSENVMAGNVMSRRAAYMYGNLLPWGPQGQVGAGLGVTTSTGATGIATPTHIIDATGQTHTIDGLQTEFIFAPDSEAPAEMMFYFPKYKAICAAEDVNHTLHNLYTLRGAKFRNGKLWSQYIQDVLDMWADDAVTMFGSHHWPSWGTEDIEDLLVSQRDLFRFIHDQTLRLANKGYTPLEIAEELELPEGLATTWANRDYYGTVYHNVRAQYGLYLGWFDGVPAHLHPLTPTAAGENYVRYMGGADAIMKKARADFDDGEFRWVAEVMNQVVFAEPGNQAAKNLLADAYEQLGYQAESGPWRNFYLSGAKELREGIKELPTPNTASADVVRNMDVPTFLDYLGVRLDGPKAGSADITVNLSFPDIGETYVLGVENGALHYSKDRTSPDAQASLTMSRDVLNDIILGTATLQDKVGDGGVTLEGDKAKVEEFLGLLDSFEFWFPIVTP